MTNPRPNLGVLYALLAYGAWGLFPLYWKQFGTVPPVEVVGHRLVWSLIFLLVIAAIQRQLGACLAVLRSPRLFSLLFLTASLLSFNWGLFIYGVNSGQVVETSLGYFINPLINVMLGLLVLRERISRWQLAAVLLALAGVICFGYHLARIPWIALGIALSFGLYGLLRKMVPVDPIPGLIVETAVIAPFAVAAITLLGWQGTAHFTDSPRLTLLFVGGGVVTALPLIWFNSAAKLLPLSTLGFFQYLAPTLQLMVGIFLFHEAFTLRHGLAFVLIWMAIGIFLASSSFRNTRQRAVEESA